MNNYELECCAAALYDGGWRATDKGEMIIEYDLSEDEAQSICDWLYHYENK